MELVKKPVQNSQTTKHNTTIFFTIFEWYFFQNGTFNKFIVQYNIAQDESQPHESSLTTENNNFNNKENKKIGFPR